MTCKDCIHHDICQDDYELGYLFKDENGNYFTDDCEHFKNKADYAKVVRCKNCTIPHNKWTGCPKLNGLIPPPDFYCGNGERRTDNAL